MQIRDEIMIIEKYKSSLEAEWDNFLSSNNSSSTLFHEMKFLSYHKDKFEDSSVIIRNNNKEIVGVFPSAFLNNNIISHPGSSYGGFIFNPNLSLNEIFEYIDGTIDFYFNNYDFKKIEVISPEKIIIQNHTDSIDFLLHKKGFQLSDMQISTVIVLKDFKDFKNFRSRTKRYIKSGKINDESYNYIQLKTKSQKLMAYKLVEKNLLSNYGKEPAHSFSELIMLENLYPNKILFFGGFKNNEMKVSQIIFKINKKTNHIFYMAKSLERDPVIDIGLINFVVNEFENDGSKLLNFGISSRGNEIKWNIHNYKEQFSKNLHSRNVWTLIK